MKSLEESLQKLRDENNENQKKIVKLETELGFSNDIDAYDDDMQESGDPTGEKAMSGARRSLKKRNRR